MPLAWLRRSSRAVAAVLLLVSMWQLPHGAEDDQMCAPLTAEAHDESKHIFTSLGDSDTQEHCAVCHWLRSLNRPFGDAVLVAASGESSSRPWAAASRSLRDPGSDRIPARAPPTPVL